MLARAATRVFRRGLCVPRTMRAVVVHETGPADVMRHEQAWPVPPLADGDVLVKNKFLGLNFIDT